VDGAVGGSVGVSRGGLHRREARQGVVDLAQQGGHAGLLGQDAGEKVGERWSFLFGSFRGQDLDHMADLARQGLKLALEGLAVFKKGVMRVIHLLEQFADGDEIVGDLAEGRVVGVVAEGHDDDPWVGRGWSGGAGKETSEAGRASSSPVPDIALNMCCTVPDSDCTWSLRALMLKSKPFCTRASLLTDGLVAHSGQRTFRQFVRRGAGHRREPPSRWRGKSVSGLREQKTARRHKSPGGTFLRIVDDELRLLAFKPLLFALGRLGSDLQGLFRVWRRGCDQTLEAVEVGFVIFARERARMALDEVQRFQRNLMLGCPTDDGMIASRTFAITSLIRTILKSLEDGRRAL
jgi:hypothetical protein